ncbi:helix-turn-helix domain-containing protein [Paenibacillus sp. S150]|uniref:helix-turn-helix domain-containing protein n=1 Tax=Paenibacillus sp. S150 TaxID=2749826 RepID=UPI002102843E|nr:helix-turn-helix domain-containing protein [Paenibacillus sp. S150]
MFLEYPDVVTVEQMCNMLGDISTKTAYKLLQANRIEHFRIGKTYKIPKLSVISYLQQIMISPPLPNTDALMH